MAFIVVTTYADTKVVDESVHLITHFLKSASLALGIACFLIAIIQFLQHKIAMVIWLVVTGIILLCVALVH